MRVIVLTGSRFGTAAHHLPYLLGRQGIEVAMVVLSLEQNPNRKRQLSKKIRKTLRIGLLGAINGIRMRRWFNDGFTRYKPIGELEDICRSNGIPFRQTPFVQSGETVELFREARADVGISLGNGYIGRKVFSIPRYGMINIHHELLPAFQNAQSIIWQIYEMSATTGYTIHRIDRTIDTGDILCQEKVAIRFGRTLEETVGRTSAGLLEASAAGLVRVLSDFEGHLRNARPQGPGRSFTTPSFLQFLRMLRNHDRLRRQEVVAHDADPDSLSGHP